MKQQLYSRYEKGTSLPGAEILHNICKTTGVSADWLLGLDALRSGGVAIGDNNFNSGRIGADCSNCPVLKAAARKMNEK